MEVRLFILKLFKLLKLRSIRLALILFLNILLYLDFF
jgi:hypothetical protein